MAKRGRPRKIDPIMEARESIRQTRAQLVWLGNKDGDLETVWNAVKFLRGVPTDVSDPVMIRKAKGNPYYEVVE